MQSCDICGITSTEVRIFDAIYDLRMSSLCERCSIIENIPIIKKPNSEQLKDSETIKVSERMKDLSGIREPDKPDTFFKEDMLRELDNNPNLELPEKENLNLIDNFHWEVMKQRRRRGLSQTQLSESLGESEIAIQMIEKSKLPENSRRIINKLEQVFQISLRKEKPRIQQDIQPVLVDEVGEKIEFVPEDEEMIFIEDEPGPDIHEKSAEEISLERAQNALGIKIPETTKKIPYLPEDRDLDINRINKKEITIGDLQKLHEKKSITIKQEQLEEQRVIEERQRLLRESRERDKQRIELEKQREIIEKEKAEQERQLLIEKRRQEVQTLREKESKDIYNYLGGSELLDNDNNSEEFNQDKSIEEFDEELV
jgi:ribosome-binding protein aMBF1 (putative translation factor)